VTAVYGVRGASPLARDCTGVYISAHNTPGGDRTRKTTASRAGMSTGCITGAVTTRTGIRCRILAACQAGAEGTSSVLAFRFLELVPSPLSSRQFMILGHSGHFRRYTHIEGGAPFVLKS
jgi:hypothetical protein